MTKNYILDHHPIERNPQTRVFNPATHNWASIFGAHAAFIPTLGPEDANDLAQTLQEGGETAYVVTRTEYLTLKIKLR